MMVIFLCNNFIYEKCDKTDRASDRHFLASTSFQSLNSSHKNTFLYALSNKLTLSALSYIY